jgi:hypothetical protein
MVFLLVPFAVWFAWNVFLSLVVAPDDWQQYIGATVLSCAGAALIEPEHWWYGFGLVGVASLLMLIGDLLLVATDWLRTQVLQKR